MNRHQALTPAAVHTGWRRPLSLRSGGSLSAGRSVGDWPPIVPAEYRAADRERVTERFDNNLPRLVEPTVERATSEWALISGVANGRYDVVELGDAARTVALESDLAESLVQLVLNSGWEYEYEGRLLAAPEDVPDLLPDDGWVAVGDLRSTPAHAALTLDRDGDVTTPPTRIRWHESPT